jgi:hypothetical protein
MCSSSAVEFEVALLRVSRVILAPFDLSEGSRVAPIGPDAPLTNIRDDLRAHMLQQCSR